MPSTQLSVVARLYVTCVVATGFATIGASAYELYVTSVEHQWFILAALTIISGSATIKLPSVPAALTVSETFVFTSVLLFGAPAGTLTVALDGLIFSLWFQKQRKSPYRLLFNIAAPALSIWTSGKVFFWVAGIEPLVERPAQLSEFLVALVVFTVLYFSLNSWLITWAVALETGERPARIWRENFLWVSLNFFCGASVAALLTIIYPLNRDFGTVDLTFLTYVGAVLPLLLVLYFTYKTSMGRVEDANKHLAAINEMYLSTIETLAMAVDAKDQITHGHIRRVQTYATQLARVLGIDDAGLLRAIEAASLLHDMGKLAVPEHILNKPGKLTDAEFEKMKLHASIGADILSAIQFPYPVIPIVRHHHENWDGTGYPDGLNGTSIPIGARILSVVDCFDALTSDRPYRPRLTDEAAIGILLQRRGTMYDPLIVDTFIHVHSTFDANVPLRQPSPALVELTRSIGDNRSPERVVQREWSESRAADIVILSRIASALTGAASVSAAFAVLGPHIRKVVAYDVCVVLRHDESTDRLVAVHCEGVDSGVIAAWSTAVGQRLSGWVAASKQCAVNSSPALDFDTINDPTLSGLRSALVVPVLNRGSVVGVIGFYSRGPDSYDTLDKSSAQFVAAHVSTLLERYERCPSATSEQLPSAFEISRRLSSRAASDGVPYAVLLAKSRDGRIQPALIMLLLKSSLRTGDMPFIASETEIGCVLMGSQLDAATRVVERLQFELSGMFLGPPAVTFSIAVVPDEAADFSGALDIASQRILTQQSAA
jgi:putative nucleotidyltransferase with HDIG domain